MARMVDADALIEELRKENQICITSTGHELTMNMVYSFINKQPTAYDVDKVVEELEANAQNIYKCIDGSRKTHKKYHYEVVE